MNQHIKEGNIYGRLTLLIGLLNFAPLCVLPFYAEEAKYAYGFIVPGVIVTAAGVAVCRLAKPPEEKITEWQSPMQQGSLPVLFAWCLAFLTGAVPFVITGQLDFVHALFESVSGWTTTGLSLVDVTRAPRVMLFHRSFMQYCGGLGFILIILILVQGKQAMNLYNAEGHSDRLMPNLKKTVRTIFLLYNGFLVIGVALYYVFGMSLFDAVCHAMSALSTAGFSTRQAGIGHYNSFPIEMVTIVLMLVGSTNFAVLMLLSRFEIRKILRVTEVRFLAGLILIFVPLIALSLMRHKDMGLLESLHNSLFGVVAAFSTTGYSITNYYTWPPFALGLIFLLMFVGGGTGSTAGGLKLTRAYLIVRIGQEYVKKLFASSRSVTAPRFNKAQGPTPIDGALIADTAGFVACYMGIFTIGSLLITLTENCTLLEAMFEFSSAFCTVGLTGGLTTVSSSTWTYIIEMIGMTLGRLEIFIVFIGIHSFFMLIKKRCSLRR
ncbi:MAG: TrkH family potassium uptake protein [Clostridiales bacterium]|nr:TrkH family potassium uptake protein [Clostridiales bacterium]